MGENRAGEGVMLDQRAGRVNSPANASAVGVLPGQLPQAGSPRFGDRRFGGGVAAEWLP